MAKLVPGNKSDALKNELNNFLLSHPNIVKTLRIIYKEDNRSWGLVIMETCLLSTLDQVVTDKIVTLNYKLITRLVS